VAWRPVAGGAVNGADAAAQGGAELRRASALVVAVLCLLMIHQLAAAALGTTSVPFVAALFVAALFVLPLVYVVPATRHWWTRYQWWLLGAQAALTYVPFDVFGSGWAVGMSGLLAGLVLLTVPPPVSWLLFGALAAAEEALWAAVGGYTYHDEASGAVFVLIAQVDVALILFGLARLADMVVQLHAARGEQADLVVSRERLRVAGALQSAVGERLAAVAALAKGALPAMARNHPLAREQIAQAGVITRQALADVRGTVGSGPAQDPPAEPAGLASGAALAPRLARTVLAVVVCGFAAQSVNVVLAAHVSPAVKALAVVGAVAIVALQLRHSWRSPGGGRPQAWRWTLALQAALTYATLLFLGPVQALVLSIFAGFLAGSALLLLPGWWAWAAYAAVVVSPLAAYAANPGPGTPLAQISYLVYMVTGPAYIGLLVYGLSWLAGLAVQLEGLRGELAAAAAARERLRVARDTHDLLGLGLSAIALKTDLIGRLIGRDDARARAEIAELRRICAAASADIRLVTGEGWRLSLDGELALVREVLVSAGIEVRADMAGGPLPAAADAVLAPVLREAVTNILRHSSARQCTIVTAASGGVLQLSVSNDGAAGPAAGDGGSGHGLANLTARVETAGGHLTCCQAGGRFELIAEIPLPAMPQVGDGELAPEGSAPRLPGG
jgi:two-component system, NarL family, sensor histidine kinase DesK